MHDQQLVHSHRFCIVTVTFIHTNEDDKKKPEN